MKIEAGILKVGVGCLNRAEPYKMLCFYFSFLIAVNLAGIKRVWQDLCSKLPYLPVDVKKPLLEEMRQALHLDTVTKGVSLF